MINSVDSKHKPTLIPIKNDLKHHFLPVEQVGRDRQV